MKYISKVMKCNDTEIGRNGNANIHNIKSKETQMEGNNCDMKEITRSWEDTQRDGNAKWNKGNGNEKQSEGKYREGKIKEKGK